ncbi:MAG TPA: prepilin-type N-terminal cleavage/methylation domain-containing protein [Candidatus Deferrimicrobiaceae bacterium]|jgi:type II secretion system protein I
MKGRGTRSGFTLIEVVVALTILAAGMAGLMALLRGSLRLSGGARDVTTATLYASQRLEEALLSPAPQDSETHGDFDAKYRWNLSAETLPAEDNVPVEGRLFRVTVLWDDGAEARSVALSASRWRRKGGSGG